jgi:hypothetical protein
MGTQGGDSIPQIVGVIARKWKEIVLTANTNIAERLYAVNREKIREMRRSWLV